MGELTLIQAFLFVASFALGVIAGYLSLYFREWYIRPVLKILPDRPMVSKEMVEHVLVVKNKGRSAAKNCIGMVTIDVERDDLLTKVPAELEVFKKIVSGEQEPETLVKYHLTKDNFREIKDEKICWADIPNPVSITINPGLISGLAICRALKPSLELYFPSEGGWKHLKMILRLREYKGKIMVSAENSKPVEAHFKIVPIKDDVRVEIISRRRY